jgi:integrase/recombinase XerD
LRNIYQRPKVRLPDGRTSYRYTAVDMGQGIRTGKLQGPFYILRLKNWVKLDADTFAEAKSEAEVKFAALDAADKGLTVAEADNIDFRNRITVTNAVAQYRDLKANKAPKTVAAYRLTLNEFADSAAAQKVRFLDEVSTAVLRRYLRDLESKKYSAKTIDTRVNIVYFMLKKFDVKARIPNDEMPAIETEAAVAFSDADLKKLFAEMDDEERVTFRFFLGSGCREQEVQFAAWSDIDLNKGTYTVRKKPEVGFNPKTHESRSVKLPSSLVAELKERKKDAADGVRWVFPSKHGLPEGHFLRKLKKISLRAGLNCGHCVVIRKADGKERKLSCKTHEVCEHIYLHRLRKTCATRWHDNGVNVRTIQAWLGHKSLETTQIYLGVTDGDKLQPNVDRAFGD